MPCFSPIDAYKLAGGGITFTQRTGDDIVGDIRIPCRGCIGCRLDRSREWALRITHEASLHKTNSFITLTYADDKLPPGGSLHYPDVQKFLKRLRKYLHPKPIRYYLCGEYGDLLDRPHYHLCLFGHAFTDIEPLRRTDSDIVVFSSPTLSRLWPLGLHSQGELNKQSAGYTARYVMKKITGDRAKTHYERINPETGEYYRLVPEFNRMSTSPGIGANWYARNSVDVHTFDYVISDGAKHSVPAYYDKILKRTDPLKLLDFKGERELKAIPHQANNTPRRLADREIVTTAKIRNLKRTLT